MKKYIKYIGLMLLGTTLLSCNKENFNYPAGHVGISKITNYAVFTLAGSTALDGNYYTLVPKGTAYSEPGVTALEGTNPLKVTTTGSVDTNTPGVYDITYAATNKDGFDATATRTVIVYSTDVTAQANDFSGDYYRAATKTTSTWTKLAPGVYSVTNVAGSSLVITAVVFNPTGYSIHVPTQIAGGNTTTSSTEVTTPGAGTLLNYSFIILNSSFGTSPRSFVKL